MTDPQKVANGNPRTTVPSNAAPAASVPEPGTDQDADLTGLAPAHAEREAQRLASTGSAAPPDNELMARPSDKSTSPVNMSDAQMHGSDLYPLSTTPNPQVPLGQVIRVPVTDPKVDEARSKKRADRTARFVKLTGVKESDIDGYNHDSVTFTTKQGGKYQMNAKGTQVRHLAGPIPPGLADEIEADRQARLEKAANA